MNNSEVTNILEHLNVAALKRIKKNSFQLIGKIPQWMEKLYPNSFDRKNIIHIRNHSPFLDNFLEDAEMFWSLSESPKLSSGSWIEKSSSGEEFFMEAMALRVNNNDMLVIELSRYSYQEKQSIIQKGRDIGLEYRSLNKLHNKLKESESQFRELFESSPDAIYVEDIDGNILDVNQAACKLQKIEKDKLVGMNIMDLIPPESKNQVYQDFSIEFEQESSFRKEGLCYTSDGKSIPVEINGSHIKYSGNPAVLLHVRDITAKKAAEEEIVKHREHLENLVDDRTSKLNDLNLELRNEINERISAENALQESTDKYSNLFQGSNDIIFIYDLNEQILEVNKKAVETFGYSKEEFSKLILSQLLGPNTKEAAQKAEQDIFKDGFAIFEIDFLKKNRTIINTEVSSNLFELNGKKVIQAVIRDVTRRKHLEEQLRQSQKMEAIGRLAGGVAHDFNNLLTVITGYSDMMLMEFDEMDPMHSVVSQIKEAAFRAASLTRQLLTFSRKEVVQRQVININELINDMEKMLGRLIREDIELFTNYGSDIGMISADPGHIEQIIMNLVVNARDAIPNGGQITIESNNCIIDQPIIRDGLEIKAGSYVKLSIKDSGQGMSNETKNRIFEPFFTTKSAGQGTGLGLSTVYGIIQQSGGYITVDSELDRGTIFHIYLPIIKDKKMEDNVIEKPKDKLKGKETVLVVEDENMVRKLACEILKMNGYNVIEASHGGIAILKSENKNIDLILTDIIMPEMNGPELVDRILKSHPKIKVLYMSGYTDDSVVKFGVLSDDVQYINKPFNSTTLLQKIRNVLDVEN